MKALVPALPLSLLLLSSGLVAGCGQSGSLHLPKDAPAKEHYLIDRRNEKKKAAAVASPVPAVEPATAPEGATTTDGPAVDTAPTSP